MYDINSPIKCSTAIRINLKSPYLKAYSDEKSKSLVIVTGHMNGSVYQWENLESCIEVVTYKNSIETITTYDHGFIISTDASTIHLWDLSFKNNIKNMDLT